MEISVRLPDGTVIGYQQGTTLGQMAESISTGIIEECSCRQNQWQACGFEQVNRAG